MRTETASAWIIASLCLFTVGLALFVFDGPEDGKLAGFMAARGFIYVGIGPC